jgi:hypothetical protein
MILSLGLVGNINALQQTPQTLCGWLPCCFATAASMICGAAEC